MPLRITAAILTYKRKDALRKTVASLLAAGDPHLEIVVVDNGNNEDGTGDMLRAEFPDVRVIANANNMGVAGRNLGVSSATGTLVVTLDDDVRGLTAADFALIREAFLAEPQLGALAFKVLRHGTSEVCNWCHHRAVETSADLRFRTYEISEGAVVYRREAFLAAGGYPESFFISHEGLELAYRLMNHGYVVAYDGRIAVEHEHESAGRPNWRRYYFDTRNVIWVAVRNQPWSVAARYLAKNLAAMAIYALRDGFPLWWVRGVRDGLKGIPEHRRQRVRWSRETGLACAEIDRHRPPLAYMIRKRLFRRGVSI